MARMREAKLKYKNTLNPAQKEKIEQIAEELPDSVIVPEDETQEEELLTEEKMHVLGVSQYGETDKIIKKNYNKSRTKAKT